MKNILSASLISLFLTACAITGPAESTWDQEERENDNDKIDLVSDLISGSKKTTANEPVNHKISQSKNTSKPADVTVPPYFTKKTVTTSVDPAWQNSASYAEWKRSRETQSSDYQEFKEYQQWLEFQKLKSK